MRIARLQIKGFRGIKSADIQLGEASVLIGPNNVGKTTIIEALALILGRDGMVRNLTEHDFFGSNPRAEDRIKIIATIIGFSDENPARLPDWFSIKRGVPKWFNPSTGDERAINMAAPYKLACNIAFQARFDHQNLEVETCRYFYDDDSHDDVFVEDAVTPVNINLVRDIGLFLVSANRSWDRMISFGSELFRRVVSTDSGLPAESIILERDRLRTPVSPLENDPRLKPVIDEVNGEISALFGKGNSVHLRVTATDSASVLDSIVPHFESGEGPPVPARRQGSGLISLQSLFLLLHFGKRRIEQGKGFCLALEEPELHLPPTVQRRVLRRLKTLSSQVIVSTHSPLVAGFSDPTELLVLSKSAEGVVRAVPVLEVPLPTETPNSIRTLYQLKRVELVTALMADTVLIPEGVLDYEWFNMLARVVELQPEADAAGALFASGVGVVPTHDAAVEATYNYISKTHIHAFPIVDGDAAGQGYIQNLKVAGATRILRWCNGWTIEDVIGWIMGPAAGQILTAVGLEIPNAPQTLEALVEKLKQSTGDGHLKGDRVAYEAISSAIGDQPLALTRAAELLDAIALALGGKETPKFVDSANDGVLIFVP
tara:strand:+ start:1676 stop:3478 length:1803 start_codon:yes stop_codon:yes gene_type:complete